MTLLIIVGVAFALFCIIAVLVITAIAQPPNKAVDYYLERRAGGGGTPKVPSTSSKPPESPKS